MEAKFRKFEEEEPKLATKKGGSGSLWRYSGMGVVTGRPLGGPGQRAGAAGWGSGLGRRAGRLAEPYGCFGH